jgi:hypothetical protein
MLRKDGVPNWVRFHSLPQSKRYADTDEERAILLARQNALATEVLKVGPCWLAQTHWTTLPGEVDWADQHDPFWATRDYGLEYAFEFLEEDVADEHDPDREPDRPWRVHAAQTAWSPSQFDRLLLSIADEKAGPTLWMASDGAIFAPYDGGIDLFLPVPAEVELLRRRHFDWLSDHPLGL